VSPNTILIIEDSKIISSTMTRLVENELQLSTKVCESFSEVKDYLAQDRNSIFAAIVDLNLPDASDGEAVNYVLKQKIPAIVLTGSYDESLREKVFAKNIVDYVVKESLSDLSYVIHLLDRLRKNTKIKVLIAEDSMFMRKWIKDILVVNMFEVLEAQDGNEALDLIYSNPDLKLIITDYHMPGLDGFELTQMIREKHGKNEMAIIGMSSAEKNTLSAKFLKKGANDFLYKPFIKEEFLCRVTQNIEIIEYIQAIKDASNRDYLTTLNNRKYFYEVGNKYFQVCKEIKSSITIGMIDLDFFKKVNDTYGHDAGDEVLKYASVIIKNSVGPSDLVARFGGEEFCVLLQEGDRNKALDTFESIRKQIEDTLVPYGKKSIKVTASIGMTQTDLTSLEAMITEADNMLYEAKESGRNKTVCMGCAST
jgi:diguanylate cyclase (GGDEF)-like protein